MSETSDIKDPSPSCSGLGFLVGAIFGYVLVMALATAAGITGLVFLVY